MNLRTENVKLTDKNVKKIYKESFPKEERMPFFLMVLLAKKENTEFLAFYDKEVLCGFIYMAIGKGITFVMFLAVDKSIRSKGYGSSILKEIQERYPNNKIVITIERCDETVSDIKKRIKRKEFYIKNGYQDTGYLIELAKIEQEILIKNGQFKQKEFSQFFESYNHGVTSTKIWKKEINVKS